MTQPSEPDARVVNPTGASFDRVLAGLIVFTVAAVTWYAADLGGTVVQVVASWLLLAGLHLALIPIANRVARIPDTPAPVRRFWIALAVAVGVFVAGDVLQVVIAVQHPLTLAAAFGGPAASVCLGLGGGLMGWVMLTWPLGGASQRERARIWLDVATVMVAAAIFGWYFWAGPGATAGPHALAGAVEVLVGPVIMLVCVFALVKLLLSDTAPFTRSCGLISGAAAATEAILHGLGPVMIGRGGLHWYLALTVLTTGLFPIAARVQHRQRRADPAGVLLRRRHFSLLPYVAIAATYALLVVVERRTGLDARGWVVLYGAITSTGLVMVRQIAAFKDNTRLLAERDALATQLRYQAFHDSLTGLPNRALFADRLEGALINAKRSGDDVVVMLIDLDDFKPVNDRLGHGAGDLLLKEISLRLIKCLRECDTVARLGGDEFAVLLSPAPSADPQTIASRIVAAVEDTVILDGELAAVGASVGIVVDRGGMGDGITLLRDADRAMYSAKRAGKGAFAMHAASAPADVEERRSLMR